MRKFQFAILAIVAVATVGILSSCHDNNTGPYGGGGGELGGSLAATSGVYAHVFNNTGSFRYKCTIHPSCTSLQGRVTVVTGATPIANDVTGIQFTGGSATTCSSLTTLDDTVHVGETVTWTNSSPLPHTVTTY